MGQKVNPIGLRLGINRTWDSRWYADGDTYAEQLHQDLGLRKYLNQRLSGAGVSRILLERPAKRIFLVPSHRQSDHGTLPCPLPAHLAHRKVEAVSQPPGDRPNHAALRLQRLRLMHMNLDHRRPNNHPAPVHP